MTHKLVYLALLVAVCSFICPVKCDVKAKKSVRQGGLRFYQIEPLEWWRTMVDAGANRNLVRGAEKSLDKLRAKYSYAENGLSRKAKSVERSDMFPAAVVANLNENQMSDLDDFEPVGATDFELINFWPGLTKRDTDYGHLR